MADYKNYNIKLENISRKVLEKCLQWVHILKNIALIL